jgi:hypothetical protein
MARTISSSIAGPAFSAPSDNPVAITSTGAVTSTGSSDAIDGETALTGPSPMLLLSLLPAATG